jgi:hypothetical protein
MSRAVRIVTRTGIRRVAVACLAVTSTLALTAGSSMATTVAFTTAPNLPTLSGVTLNGQSQTTSTTWSMANDFTITSSGTNNGWNLTVNGNSAAGKSAVFKQYCPNATCGTHSGPGYVAGGFTLPADSLTWRTAGATWTSAAPRPAYQCNVSACPIGKATATKVVSASTSVALGGWTSSGSSTLSLSTAAGLRKLQTGEVYRVDVVWTVSSGP